MRREKMTAVQYAAWKRKALKALDKSIRHWTAMRDGDVGGNNRPCAEHCACCIAFPDDDCSGCPVAVAGFKDCKGTPFYNAERNYYALAQLTYQCDCCDRITTNPHCNKSKRAMDKFSDSARDMLVCLRRIKGQIEQDVFREKLQR